MINSSKPILIVTPVWNDSTRLADYGESLTQAFAASPLSIRWVIGDDGSSSAEKKRLRHLREHFSKTFPFIEIHTADAHRGKGSIIRETWNDASEAEWLAFVDADGSVSATDLLHLIEQAITAEKSVLGIRKQTANTKVIESPWRSIFHLGFLWCTNLILGLHCEDPQCGVKILLAKDYRAIAHRLEENGLAFDSELLTTLLIHGADWLEIPVTWTEKKNGKVRPLRDAWGMLFALLRIRQRMI